MKGRRFRPLSGAILSVVLGIILLHACPAWAAVGVDATASIDKGTPSLTVTSPAFSTVSGNELLLAFIATDSAGGTNTTVTGVAGGGLTWVLVQRTNVQLGTAEIWRAFAPSALSNVTVAATLSKSVLSSLTVMSFSGVDTTGTNGSGAIGKTGTGNANPGAPTATVVTTRNGSLVLGVGDDWDKAIVRTPGAGQNVVHQDLAPSGDTYWVQMQSSPTPLSGTSVTINDTAPTTDRYNLSIAEVLPAVGTGGTGFTISGTVSPAAVGSGTTLTLSGGPVGGTATGNSSGNYSFVNLPNGTYTVTPSNGAFTFNPPNQQVIINGANPPSANFTAVTYSISGAITPPASGSGTTLTLSGGPVGGTATADSAGNFTLANLPNGNYTVTPSKGVYTFTPANLSVPISGSSQSSVNFTIITYSISGTVSPLPLAAGTILTLSGTPSATTPIDGNGNYTFTGLSTSTYTITPSDTGATFNPASATVPIPGTNVVNVNFTAQAATQPPLNLPDLSDIIPTTAFSIGGSGSTRQLQYTHDTFNGGAGPLSIQPVYNSNSGNYLGYQQIYSLDPTTQIWTIAQTVPIAGTFIFDAVHGHYHFPFTQYGLFAANADGSIGALVAPSTKVEFCIANSFIYDHSLPNAGFGSQGPCTDPTSVRGLSIGAVDEYDKGDAGQAINIANLPDGTYWLRAIVDPDDYFVESDKSNNETDTELAITGSTVQVLQTVNPVLPPPPSVTLTSPSDGATVTGTIQLTATTPMTGGSGVQFLIDGQPFGIPIMVAPYTVSWNASVLLNGTYWIAAQVTDPTSGRTGTSAVAVVTVNNADTIPPTVAITNPSNGETVSAVIRVTANAAAEAGIPSVQFYLDNVALGSPVTAPPFIDSWDTEQSTASSHTLTAIATDQSGLVGDSAPITVTVDNSHPPNLIGLDANLSVDGLGTLKTPAFTTTTISDVLVAFVSYDGPSGSPQTAAVSGAGLFWTLLKRSNMEHGTAEIWTAQATDFLSSVTVSSQPLNGSSWYGSLTVIAFTNAAGTGVVGQTSAPSGAPDIYLPGITAGNWVFAVGNDWDKAVARTPVTGQMLIHQDFSPSGDTYWVQATATPSTANGLVDIHDTAPTADQWNYAAVEIVATLQ